MNEAAARRTLLVRAYEREPASASPWSETDRAWATQAAAEVEGERATPDAFIARRSALAIERLGGRDKHVQRLLNAVTWRPWLCWTLAVLALAAGFAADAIGSEKRVNLLAPPLLALLAWNLFVYLLIIVRGLWGAFDARARGLGPLARAISRITHAVSKPPRRHGTVPAAAFLQDWAQASGTLTAARIGRLLHQAAAAFALGALGGMYLRGIALEYRAGWESTFLDADAVHWLLGVVLGPASALTGIALPEAAGYEALRFSAGSGVIAAPWLHLYAVTVALIVLAPRLLLALGDRWLEARQTARFPLRLDDAYFQRLTRVLRGAPATVRVLPYSYQLSPQATLGLNNLFTQALGARTIVSIAPGVAFGEEDTFDAGALAGNANVLVPLFALTATPEHENHGVFIDRLAQAAGHLAQSVLIVDESAFRRQFGADSTRRAERRALWQKLASERKRTAVFVDLEQPDLDAAESALQAALDAEGGSRR
jgi:hypothetical protein